MLHWLGHWQGCEGFWKGNTKQILDSVLRVSILAMGEQKLLFVVLRVIKRAAERT